MLGLNARVESAQIGGKTVYRVRMGPYGSASELAEAKAKGLATLNYGVFLNTSFEFLIIACHLESPA